MEKSRKCPVRVTAGRTFSQGTDCVCLPAPGSAAEGTNRARIFLAYLPVEIARPADEMQTAA
jgi:hypothetical protein